jgi:hypothetical protein
VLIKLLVDIPDYGGGAFTAGTIMAADDKIAPVWIAEGKAEEL